MNSNIHPLITRGLSSDDQTRIRQLVAVAGPDLEASSSDLYHEFGLLLDEARTLDHCHVPVPAKRDLKYLFGAGGAHRHYRNMPKTNRDFLYALFQKLVGAGQGKFLQLSFEQQFLPMFPKSEKLDEVIPDEQFDQMLSQAEKELPAFAQFLTTQSNRPLPPTFGTKN